MPKERYRRNIHEEDRQVYTYTDTPTKEQTIGNMYIKVGKLRAQAEKAGSKKEAKRLYGLETKTIGILRKLTESKSRR